MPNIDLRLGDCLEVMKTIPEGSVDLVLTDLPYGTTACKWDTVIPFEPLWEQYWRIVKPNAAVVLTASQPFTTALIASQIDKFKYDWVWRKPRGTGHLNAKKMPMKDKEDICVFYKSLGTYNPQFEKGVPYNGSARVGKKQDTENYGKFSAVGNDNEGKRYPKQVLEFPTVGRGGVHPTQKPVALMEYLIKTYTNENDTVLDNTMGSGTTGVACVNTKRNFIGIENHEPYFRIAEERIAQAKNTLEDFFA